MLLAATRGILGIFLFSLAIFIFSSCSGGDQPPPKSVTLDKRNISNFISRYNKGGSTYVAFSNWSSTFTQDPAYKVFTVFNSQADALSLRSISGTFAKSVSSFPGTGVPSPSWYNLTFLPLYLALYPLSIELSHTNCQDPHLLPRGKFIWDDAKRTFIPAEGRHEDAAVYEWQYEGKTVTLMTDWSPGTASTQQVVGECFDVETGEWVEIHFEVPQVIQVTLEWGGQELANVTAQMSWRGGNSCEGYGDGYVHFGPQISAIKISGHWGIIAQVYIAKEKPLKYGFFSKNVFELGGHAVATADGKEASTEVSIAFEGNALSAKCLPTSEYDPTYVGLITTNGLFGRAQISISFFQSVDTTNPDDVQFSLVAIAQWERDDWGVVRFKSARVSGSFKLNDKFMRYSGVLDDENSNCVPGEHVNLEFADGRITLERFLIEDLGANPGDCSGM